ncbi:hypothetical protein ACSZNO_21125 [Aeromonas veronii]
MSKNGIAEYQKFLEFRQTLIDLIHRHSISHEIKNNKVVRPVGFIRSERELLDFTLLIDTWKNMVNELVSIDPVRFPENSHIFNPPPRIIYNVDIVKVYIDSATSSRLIEKRIIVDRMKRHIKALEKDAQRASTFASTHVLNELREELAAMEADNETHYRCRNSNGTETICLLTMTDGETVRERCPFSGFLIDNRSGRVQIKKKREQAERRDKLDFLSCEEVKCSLPSVAGILYRESELLAQKKRYSEQKSGVVVTD